MFLSFFLSLSVTKTYTYLFTNIKHDGKCNANVENKKRKKKMFSLFVNGSTKSRKLNTFNPK